MRTWMLNKPLLDQAGSMLLPVILITAVIVTTAAVTLIQSSSLRKVNRHLSLVQGAERARSKLMGLVFDPRSWQATQAANPSAFSTFGVGSPPRPLDLRAGDGASYSNSGVPTAGFTAAGAPCNEFGISVGGNPGGNDRCPLRYEVSLIDHQLSNNVWVDTLRFELTYFPGEELKVLPFNAKAARFTFDTVRNYADSNPDVTCTLTGGTFNPDTGVCTVTVTQNRDCVSEFFRGPSSTSSTGHCVAATVPTATCPAEHTVVSFDTAGVPQCVPVPR